jgi:SCY1-like protein 1
MQLGGGHVSSTLSHAAEWAAEAEVEASNPWGNDDLMDINADQDDWSEMVFFSRANLQMLTSNPGAFETAPVLGHETYEQSVKAPLPVRAESEYFRNQR